MSCCEAGESVTKTQSPTSGRENMPLIFIFKEAGENIRKLRRGERLVMLEKTNKLANKTRK